MAKRTTELHDSFFVHAHLHHIHKCSLNRAIRSPMTQLSHLSYLSRRRSKSGSGFGCSWGHRMIPDRGPAGNAKRWISPLSRKRKMRGGRGEGQKIALEEGTGDRFVRDDNNVSLPEEKAEKGDNPGKGLLRPLTPSLLPTLRSHGSQSGGRVGSRNLVPVLLRCTRFISPTHKEGRGGKGAALAPARPADHSAGISHSRYSPRFTATRGCSCRYVEPRVVGSISPSTTCCCRHHILCVTCFSVPLVGWAPVFRPDPPKNRGGSFPFSLNDPASPGSFTVRAPAAPPVPPPRKEAYSPPYALGAGLPRFAPAAFSLDAGGLHVPLCRDDRGVRVVIITSGCSTAFCPVLMTRYGSTRHSCQGTKQGIASSIGADLASAASCRIGVIQYAVPRVPPLLRSFPILIVKHHEQQDVEGFAYLPSRSILVGVPARIVVITTYGGAACCSRATMMKIDAHKVIVRSACKELTVMTPWRESYKTCDCYWITSFYFISDRPFHLPIRSPNLVRFHPSSVLSEYLWRKNQRSTSHSTESFDLAAARSLISDSAAIGSMNNLFEIFEPAAARSLISDSPATFTSVDPTLFDPAAARFLISDSPATISGDPTLLSNLAAQLIGTPVGLSCIRIIGVPGPASAKNISSLGRKTGDYEAFPHDEGELGLDLGVNRLK
eukprot:Gb_17114 [translate_table: standard]